LNDRGNAGEKNTGAGDAAGPKNTKITEQNSFNH